MLTTVQMSMLTAAVTVSVVAVWYLKRSKRVYVKVGKVSKLFLFPVKSLKGIEVNKAECVHKGMELDNILDRSYMLISGDGVLVSQREEPSLVLLTPSILKNQLHISGPEVETLKIDLNHTLSNNKVVDVRIHSDAASAVDCGDEPSKWFQKFLNRTDVRLVCSGWDLPKRKYLKNNPLFVRLKKKFDVAFTDYSPFHLLSQASIDDLNSKLQETKISVNNFRPNILVEGCKYYEEDQWKYIKFSSGAELEHLMPCGRCILTTNDPDTGIKSNKEPLVTLRKYRTPTDKELRAATSLAPCLGVNLCLSKKGHVAVGDDIFAVVDHNLLKL